MVQSGKSYVVGDVVRLTHEVRNLDDELVTPSAITLAVTKPDGTSSSPTPTASATGKYYYDYTTAAAGGHKVLWSTTTPTTVSEERLWVYPTKPF